MNITLTKFQGQEIFWYEDSVMWQMVIGFRGGSEYRVSIWDFERQQDKFQRDHGRRWNETEALEHCIKLGIIQSQYIDFEEIKDEQKLLL